MRVHSTVMVFVCVALLLQCDLLKRGQDAGTDAAATTTGNTANNNTSQTTANNAATAAPTVDPSQGATSGCAWPDHGNKDVTITKGCVVLAKHNVSMDEGATITFEEGVKVSFD